MSSNKYYVLKADNSANTSFLTPSEGPKQTLFEWKANGDPLPRWEVGVSGFLNYKERAKCSKQKYFTFDNRNRKTTTFYTPKNGD